MVADITEQFFHVSLQDAVALAQDIQEALDNRVEAIPSHYKDGAQGLIDQATDIPKSMAALQTTIDQADSPDNKLALAMDLTTKSVKLITAFRDAGLTSENEQLLSQITDRSIQICDAISSALSDSGMTNE